MDADREIDADPTRGIPVEAIIAELRERADEASGRIAAADLDDITARWLDGPAPAPERGGSTRVGLVERPVLLDALRRALAGHRPVALLVGNMDRFRAIADVHGILVADRVLDEVTARLAGGAAAHAVCRLGGDGFAVLVDEPDSDDAVRAIGEELARAIARPIAIDDVEIHATMSFGIVRPAPRSTVETVLREADAALDVAKREGRNRCVVFDDVRRRELARRSHRLGELRDAIARGALTLRYQPVVDMVSGEMVSVEALVRWPHPDLGELGAESFVALAEDAGLIGELGRWVLEHASGALARWADRPGLGMAVNVSARQLADDSIIDVVREAVAESGIDPHRLTLEITETAVMDDLGRSLDVLARLARLGVSFSIDDFGTGFSSLAQLRRLPVRVLKIDRSFVIDLDPTTPPTPSGPRHTAHAAPEPGTDDPGAFVASILGLASALDLEVIAEGVTSTRQRDLLISMGCRLGQGHLYAPALSEAELVAWAPPRGSGPH